MTRLYQELFEQQEFLEAVRLGRWELFQRKERRAYFEMLIPLEDWLLPVVYVQRQLALNLRKFTPEEEAQYLERRGQRAEFETPTHGFVGRDLEILKLEKGLLRHNILLLQGMGGTGKTTLLKYVRMWWERTQFTGAVFYFGYDERAWTVAQMLHEISGIVFRKYDRTNFQAMGLSARIEKMIELLRGNCYGLILDNLESVTGQQLAIQNTLSGEERERLRKFLGRLVGGKTRVVLGSRGREEWLQPQTVSENVYVLQGLDRESRSTLAERILKRQVGDTRAKELQQGDDFVRLMKVLAGYPLAMEVVLANLKHQTAEEILQALDAGDVRLDKDSGDKTESILKCVEYSYSNLDIESQKLLVCLAPFQGFINRTALVNYSNSLKALEPFKDYPFDKFDTAIQEAVNWGLISPLNTNEPDILAIQPLFPYFLRTKLTQLDRQTQQALQEGFKSHYRDLARYYLYQLLLSKDFQKAQIGTFICRLEYDNMFKALEICLEQYEKITIFYCLDTYYEKIGDVQSGLKLSEFICQTLEQYPTELKEGALLGEMIIAFGQRASGYLKTQKYPQAKKDYEKALQILERILKASTCIKQRKDYILRIATIYHQLGIVAQKQREYELATQYFQKALDIYIEFDDQKPKQASTYHQLGRISLEQRNYDQARRDYQQALDIYIEYDERYEQASVYHHLGTVALMQRKYEQAQQYCEQALKIYDEYNKRHSKAYTYHQLGRIAEEQRDYDKALRNYQQALDIFIRFDDLYNQAQTYHHLGKIAEAQGDGEQAKEYFLQALQIYKDSQDEDSSGIPLSSLGRIYQATQDESLLIRVAEMLGVTVEELRERWSV